MKSSVFELLLTSYLFLLQPTRATTPVYRVPPQINVGSVLDLGDVLTSGIQQYVARDLGFSGKVGQKIINVYGDTYHSNATAFPDGRLNGQLPGFVANSAAVGNPSTIMTVKQYQMQSITTLNGATYPYQTPAQFCPYFPEETPISNYGMGITAIQDVDGVNGLLFFMKLYRPSAQAMKMIGGGIAKVSNVTAATGPTCTRLSRYYWDAQTMPWYGTYGTLSQHGKDPDGNTYIYAYGQANTTTYGSYLYLARVPKTKAFNTKAFTYWNGTGWQTKPLTAPQASQAVLEAIPLTTSSSTSTTSTTSTSTSSISSSTTSSSATITTSSTNTNSSTTTMSSTTTILSTTTISSTTITSSTTATSSTSTTTSSSTPTSTSTSSSITTTSQIFLPTSFSLPTNAPTTLTTITGTATSSSATTSTDAASTSGLPIKQLFAFSKKGLSQYTYPQLNTTRPMLQSGQASLYYSPYHKCYIMTECITSTKNPFYPLNSIQMRTSYLAQGPWSQPVVVLAWNQTISSVGGGNITIPGAIYGPAVQPWWDATGKSVRFTFTYKASVQRAILLTFA